MSTDPPDVVTPNDVSNE